MTSSSKTLLHKVIAIYNTVNAQRSLVGLKSIYCSSKLVMFLQPDDCNIILQLATVDVIG